jgi:hypothetical protein
MMAIDYSVAGCLSNVVRALAIIESGEDEQAIGDGGQAYGILQYHPATLVHWYALGGMSVRDTWTTASIKACTAFLRYFDFLNAVLAQQNLIIQAHNLGVAGVFTLGRRNLEYLGRWQQAYLAITKPPAWEGIDALQVPDKAGSGLE